MSDGSLDTRSLRKEALTMLKSGEAINKTLRWTMRTKMQTSPCRKVYMEVPPALQASQTSQDIRHRTGSPLSTPNLDRATLTHRGISPAHQSPSALVDASASIMTLKGNIVPIHYVKDAMVDVIRKEKVVLRSRNTVGSQSLYLTDDISTASHNDFNDSFSSLRGHQHAPKQTFMDGTQAKIVSSLTNPKEEASYTWKRMKKLRDERNATLERRKAREDMIYNFKRAVHSTEQNEFHRAYREQHSQQEHIVRKNHQDRKHERTVLDEKMDKKIATKKKQQQDEGKYMRAMLRDSADRARASLHEEIVFNKMNKELNGLVKSQSMLDISTSSVIVIPDHLQNRVKEARSLAEYQKARADIKQYYESSMSERIALYTQSRERAITRASEIDHPINLSPILGADLFFDSLPSTASVHDDYERFLRHSQRVNTHPTHSAQSTTHSPSATSPRGRPSTSDIALQEYFASRVSQQEQFELENFSLHSQDDVSLAQGLHHYY